MRPRLFSGIEFAILFLFSSRFFFFFVDQLDLTNLNRKSTGQQAKVVKSTANCLNNQ